MNCSLVSDTLDVTVHLHGAEVTSVKNKKGLEFMWQAKKEIWPRYAPVLFPIVGKLKDNIFSYKSKSYNLTQHGFARDSKFELVEKKSDRAIFQLVSNAKSKESFPFDFVFQITHSLAQNKLTTRYKIYNPSDEVLFFSVGAHPGFACPLLKDEVFEDYFLEFKSSDYLITELNEGLRTLNKKQLPLEKNKLFLSKKLLEKDALVFENAQINEICLRSDKSAHKITMECKNWPYFGIWSKKDGNEFICLEPWYGIADSETGNLDFSEKEGIIKLEAKESFDCSFSITFE